MFAVHRISRLTKLYSHSRFALKLRSQEGVYHSLILFRLSAGQFPKTFDDTPAVHEDGPVANDRQIYVMEAHCPHLGADMSHADIEECETGIVAVCPWHR